MKVLTVVLVTGLLAACASGYGYNPRYYYNEVQVVNLTGATITDVSLRVTGSTLVLDCAEVAKFAMCADRFGKLPYPKQGMELSWKTSDGSSMTDNSNPHVAAYFPAAFPLRVVLEINADGSVKPFYEQEEPGNDRDFI